MNDHKSVYIRQWNWELCEVSIWRNGQWGNEHKNPTPSSRRRLRNLMQARAGRFATQHADLGLHCMTLWAHEYEEPQPVLEVKPTEEFFTPDLTPDPNQAYYDFRETMDDFMMLTRS